MFDTSAAGHDFNIDNGTFVVDASANRVGIGTATPSALLDVNGALTATTIAGTLTTAAQTNITSVGTLSALNVGNITSTGNLSLNQDGANIYIGADLDLRILHDGSNGTFRNDTGNLTIDVGGDLTLDAGGNQFNFAIAGTTKGRFEGSSDSFVIRSVVSDGDLIFRGNDGGSSITALTLDMSAAGEATFNSNIISGGKIGIGTGTSTINADSILHLKSAQPNIYFEDTDDSKSWRLEAGSVFKVQNITTSTEAFRVKQNGAFGIGTPPTDFFDLLGSVSTADIGTDNSAEIVANFVPNSSGTRNGRFRIAGTETPHNHSIALISDSSSNVGMAFVTTSGGTRGERVVIDSAGNVGIGESSPSAKIHVKKTAASTQHYDQYATAIIEDTEARLQLVATDGGSNAAGLLLSNETKHWGLVHHGTGNSNIFSIGYHATSSNNTDISDNLNDILNISTGGDVSIGSIHSGFSGWRVLNIRGDSTGGMLNFENSSGTRSFTFANQGSGMRYQAHISGGYHRFETHGNPNYPLYIANSGVVSINDSGTSAHQFKVTSSTMAARFQSGNGGYSSVTWTGNNGTQIGSLTTYDGRIWIGAQNPQGTGSNGEIVVKPGTTSTTGGVGTTLGRTPDVSLEVNGPLKITNNTNAGVSQTHTNMTVANSGKLLINFASIGTMTSGDTIVFTYAATSWKSWFFKIRWSSTGGYIGELWAGGYNNNSDGYQILNPRYYAAGSGDGASNTTVEGATLSVSRSGQANTMTLTLNNNHVHPLFEIEYSCGGGEGYPNSSKASITVNS